MPFRNYSPEERAEALAVLQECVGDIATARTDLLERWGYAPSLPTLTTWLLSEQNGQGKGNVHQCGGRCHRDASKGFEAIQTTPLAKLLDIVSQIAEDPAFVVIVIGKSSTEKAIEGQPCRGE